MKNTLAQKRKLHSEMPAAPVQTRRLVDRQMAWSTESQQFQNRDPLFHVTEGFQTSFDAMGTRRAQMLSGSWRENVPGLTDVLGGLLRQARGENEQEAENGMEDDSAYDTGSDEWKVLQRQTRMNDEVEENKHGQGRLMNKFSEISFMRGKMSAAVLNGTGNMMLFSCLKRTLGQSEPMKLQQRKLFQGGSRAWKPMNTKAADAQATTLMRNEVFSKSAVGLVFNVTKDARRTVEQMTELVENGGTGTDTWEKLWPFLSSRKEETLLEEYQRQLDGLGNSPEDEQQRSLLTKAITRTRGLISKKTRMRNDFLFRLRSIGNQAREAAAQFSDETFQTELRRALGGEALFGEPPEGEPPPEEEMPPDGLYGDGLDDMTEPDSVTEPAAASTEAAEAGADSGTDNAGVSPS